MANNNNNVIAAVELIAALERKDPPSSLDEIRSIASADPIVLKSKLVWYHHDGVTPLRVACANPQVDDAIIEYLIREWPDSVYIPSTGGMLPIHMACCAGMSIESIQRLALHHPESLEMESSLGCPLHCASISPHTSLETIQFLYEQYPKAIHCKSCRGDLPLHLSIESKLVEVVQFLAEADPKCLLVSNKYGQLPIHTAAYQGASLDILQCLASLCPESLQTKDNNGDIPLQQVACHGDFSAKQVLEYLIANKGDFDPSCLLHEFYRHKKRQNLELIRFVLEKVPESVRTKNDRGELPLHRVIKGGLFNCSFWEAGQHLHLRALVQAYPTGLFVPCRLGSTPLDTLKRSRGYSEDTKSFLEEQMRQILGGFLQRIAAKFGVPETVLEHQVLPFVL
ncbi:ankyrin 3, node of Ranvier (ankyrin G) [Seminavis robusta]|uniref:Ankyrin 3, node of Ranvier (Ankyrin G) n=1 Tax=Seminavis robusta TaxID=568900 RepID=A0A9N8HXR1_9STRA|nr:ankyrin 3, node of Ranvier (ankyrin G) [Seminavis robusta]|eukprot:Sro2547_g330870.1 ankyrin 3, node of Ranvier (ankyrin G) (396) ;mRNA; r:11099-12286